MVLVTSIEFFNDAYDSARILGDYVDEVLIFRPFFAHFHLPLPFQAMSTQLILLKKSAHINAGEKIMSEKNILGALENRHLGSTTKEELSATPSATYWND